MAYINIVLMLALLMTGLCFAQPPSMGGGISTQALEAQPDLGIQMGAFMVYPQLKSGMEHNDNIYAVKSDKVSDWIATLAPRMMAASTWSRHQFKLDAGLDKGFYLNNADENYLDAHLRAGGRINIFQGSYFEARGGYARYHEERTSPDVRYTLDRYAWAEPSRFKGLTGSGLLHHEAGRFFIDAEANAVGYVYEAVGMVGGGTQNQSYRDRMEYVTQVQLGYEWLPNVRPFIKAEYNWRQYDRKDEALRDSEGYRVGAGTKIYMGGITTGEIWGGYLRQDYDFDDRIDISGVWYGLALTWEVTRLTSVRAEVDRLTREITYDAASGIIETNTDLSIKHDLLRNLSVLLAFSYIHDEYKGVDIDDEYYKAGPGLSYRLNRNLSADLRYEYVTMKSFGDDLFLGYAVNRVIVSLTGDF